MIYNKVIAMFAWCLAFVLIITTLGNARPSANWSDFVHHTTLDFVKALLAMGIAMFGLHIWEKK